MGITVKYKGNIMTHTKGATAEQVIEVIEKRMARREQELQKREWVVKEYRSLEAKQAEDREWLAWVKAGNFKTIDN